MGLNWYIFTQESFWISIGLVVLVGSLITNFYLWVDREYFRDKVEYLKKKLKKLKEEKKK